MSSFFYNSALFKTFAGYRLHNRGQKPENLILLDKRMGHIENDKKNKGFEEGNCRNAVSIFLEK